jgi:hypothetical protein
MSNKENKNKPGNISTTKIKSNRICRKKKKRMARRENQKNKRNK